MNQKRRKNLIRVQAPHLTNSKTRMTFLDLRKNIAKRKTAIINKVKMQTIETNKEAKNSQVRKN